MVKFQHIPDIITSLVGAQRAFYLPTEHQLVRNNMPLTTIPLLTRSYMVKFQVRPHLYEGGWTSVFRMSISGAGDKNTAGSRIPAVFFHGASPSDSKNRLLICSSVNNNQNFCYDNQKKTVPKVRG